MDAFVERAAIRPASGGGAVWLFVALLCGAVVSAVSNRQLAFSFDTDMWIRNLAGGFLMGSGATLVPGGNAVLMLQDLPALSLHAAIAYIAMVFGIAITLMAFDRWMGSSMTVKCYADIATVWNHQQDREWQTPGCSQKSRSARDDSGGSAAGVRGA